MFLKLQEAYQILGDPSKRAIYDKTIDFQDNELINKMFSVFLNNFLNQVHDIVQKKRSSNRDTTSHAHDKPPDLRIDVTASLDEVYSNMKKVVKIKVLRDNVMRVVSFLLELKDFREPCVFENAGDNQLADVIFNIQIAPHERFCVDQVMDTYDLTTEIEINLYEYYFGGKKTLPFLANEVLTFDIPVPHNNVVTLSGKGLPFGDTRGDLVVILKVKLPKSLPPHLEIENFLHEYFNGNDVDTFDKNEM